MMRLVEFATDVVVCHIGDLHCLPDWFTAQRRQQQFAQFTAFDVTEDSAAVERLRQTATDDLPRIMDRFRLWTPRTSPGSRQLLVDELFDVAAPDYEQIVDTDQNRENIENLLDSICRHFGDSVPLAMLDFGCGSGISAQVQRPVIYRISGFDRCPGMRALAAAAGLNVFTPYQFMTLPSHAFDAVFASYVFHLHPSVSDLIRLWTLTRPGGVVVANFHKGYGFEQAGAIFSSLGAISTELAYRNSKFVHGRYCLYARTR